MRILSAVATALLFGIPGSASVAQTTGLPPGNYQQTCRNIRTSGPQLIASSRRRMAIGGIRLWIRVPVAAAL